RPLARGGRGGFPCDPDRPALRVQRPLAEDPGDAERERDEWQENVQDAVPHSPHLRRSHGPGAPGAGPCRSPEETVLRRAVPPVLPPPGSRPAAPGAPQPLPFSSSTTITRAWVQGPIGVERRGPWDVTGGARSRGVVGEF